MMLLLERPITRRFSQSLKRLELEAGSTGACCLSLSAIACIVEISVFEFILIGSLEDKSAYNNSYKMERKSNVIGVN